MATRPSLRPFLVAAFGIAGIAVIAYALLLIDDARQRTGTVSGIGIPLLAIAALVWYGGRARRRP
jgi:hypothetical protein